MSSVHIFLAVIGLITPLVVSKHLQFYRKDYTYVADYDAFYKLHCDFSGVTWDSAFQACDDEGAKLFYPKGNEWKVVKKLTDVMPVAPNASDIFVGFHDEFNLGEFITVDGKPTETPLNAVTSAEDDEHPHALIDQRCMIMDSLTGQFKISSCKTSPNEPIRPFVCKKVDNESCPTIDNEYKYVKSSKKCYKVHKRQKFWETAMQTCYMEGGILAVLEKRTDVPSWAEEGHYYFVGFRKMFSSPDFYTVKGEKFENAYFKNWYVARDQVNRDCGVMQYYLNQEPKMKVENCLTYLPFICEMDAQ